MTVEISFLDIWAHDNFGVKFKIKKWVNKVRTQSKTQPFLWRSLLSIDVSFDLIFMLRIPIHVKIGESLSDMIHLIGIPKGYYLKLSASVACLKLSFSLIFPRILREACVYLAIRRLGGA